MSHTILVRCDASPQIGYGHAVRCVAVGAELQALGCTVEFAMRAGAELVEDRGFRTHRGGAADSRRWLAELVHATRARAILVDARDDLSRADLESLPGVLIASLDDASERRLAAQVAFYPPVPQVEEWDWSGFTGTRHVGWQWVALRRGFGQRPRVEGRVPPSILVTMGGSDPARMTFRALDALERVAGDFEATVVIGKGFAWTDELRARTSAAPRSIVVRHAVEDMAGLMAEADLAIASFGVTAYELAAMGVPAVHLCLSDDHARSASAFEKARIAVSLGLHDRVTPERLAAEVDRLLQDAAERRAMSARARELVDGRGSERIAREIFARLEARP